MPSIIKVDQIQSDTGNVTFTGNIAFPAGSATLPSITTVGDTNTGIFFPAADIIAFTEGGVESTRIDSAGSFYVGKANNSTAADGFVVFKAGETRISCTANDVLNLNRNTSNGAIQRFFRDGSFVGQIEGLTTGLTYTGVHGITFTATQVASANANTLDDYEEGTWTPTAWGGGNISSAAGRYIKIGKQVYVSWDVQYGSTANGDAAGFQNLPFTVFNANSAQGCTTISYHDFGSSFVGLVIANSTRVIYYNHSGGTLLNNAFSSKRVMGGAVYEVA